MFKLDHAIRNIFLLLILLVNSAAAYEVLQGPTEVRYWDTGSVMLQSELDIS
jgi:hypothetical protein